jgi:hypothetical protein
LQYEGLKGTQGQQLGVGPIGIPEPQYCGLHHDGCGVGIRVPFGADALEPVAPIGDRFAICFNGTASVTTKYSGSKINFLKPKSAHFACLVNAKSAETSAAVGCTVTVEAIRDGQVVDGETCEFVPDKGIKGR